jgi:hypothetical protein
VNFVFYGEDGSILKAPSPFVRIAASRRDGSSKRSHPNGSSQEEAIGEHGKNKASEESILPVVFDESEVKDGSQHTYKVG